MIAQVSAIQSITEPLHRPQVDTDSLPAHLRDLLDQTSRDLDIAQQRRLADVLLHYSDLFPTPGSTLTGHTDAVEHEIDTGDSSPIRCAPSRMSPQKMKKEEECVTEMLTGGQIEPSDSPWSSPVVLVTKKDGGTRFCVDYRRPNDVTVKDAYPLPRIDDTLDMLAGKQWFSTLDLASGYWQVSLSQEARVKRRLRHIPVCSSSGLCHLAFVTHLRRSSGSSSSSSSFIHNIYKQIHIHINDKFAQYNTLIVKLDNMKYVQVCICCKVLYGQ